MEKPIPVGLCQCGCGQATNPARQTARRKGLVKGKPQRFVCGHSGGHRWIPAIYRLFAKMELDGECWNWTGATENKGYGQIFFHGKLELVHRVSWTLHIGPIPEGWLVLHSCDAPPCFRPTHLFLGDYQDNSDDCVSKGRHQHGETHSFAKLNRRSVVEIRSLLEAGVRQREIAE